MVDFSNVYTNETSSEYASVTRMIDNDAHEPHVTVTARSRNGYPYDLPIKILKTYISGMTPLSY